MNKTIKITLDQEREWCSNPVTLAFRDTLRVAYDDVIDSMAALSGEQQEDALRFAKLKGQQQVLAEILEEQFNDGETS